MRNRLKKLIPAPFWRLFEIAHVPSSVESGPANQGLLPAFEYIPEGWRYLETHPTAKGWNSDEVLRVYERNWPLFVSRLATKEPLSFAPGNSEASDLNHQNTFLVFAYALALAAHGKKSISLLDWGGAIGHYYLLAKTLLPGIDIQYHCKDVPVLAERGKQLFPEANFYSDESCFLRTYDFVLASGSMQFSQDWSDLLSRLAAATSSYLLITRLPTVKTVPSYVFIQRPYAHGYDTEHLAWCINREEFLHIVQAKGLQLMREFVVADNHPIPNAPGSCEYYGFLFRKPTEN